MEHNVYEDDEDDDEEEEMNTNSEWQTPNSEFETYNMVWINAYSADTNSDVKSAYVLLNTVELTPWMLN